MMDGDSMDPRPEAPEPPTDDMCCGSGCDPCIWDIYQKEWDSYQRVLAEWKARHVSRTAIPNKLSNDE